MKQKNARISPVFPHINHTVCEKVRWLTDMRASIETELRNDLPDFCRSV